ncbi:2-phospho-L-lactate guanylyltransferase [Pseudonocardia nigra]|uniref:2-phospho-L-lactate guanylyltransferase n=1 Tax=Pseudonocardia nigra TaxID=1921578 RepID=UPI0027E34928|nr:2-phospho-L-lactate guanylyltransferase [Pseudonocardia nigra]
MGCLSPVVDLVVPVKSLSVAKSRLRGAADRGIGEDGAHARLALALAHDTFTAVRGAARVRNLVVVSSDPVVAAEFGAVGVEVVPDGPLPGLNRAYERGADLLRERDPGAAVGALQADLPALRPAELDAAISAAAALFTRGAQRAFVVDADGTGSTFLLAAPGTPLRPLFGVGSALRHRESGAEPLAGRWPGLRRDVDTAEDLRAAADLGLGEHTLAVLTPVSRC